jgi:peptidoglycan/LPS O-acetylase OafA/YrhL
MEKKEEEKPKEKKPLPLPDIDYEYLNGLRGWGAFAVFLFHYTEAFWKLDKRPDVEDGLDGSWNPPAWLVLLRTSPLGIVIAGYCAVSVFFVLSGFVLPLQWFLKRRYSSIYGGVYRRYLRLMLPMLLALSFYYLAAKLDWTTRPGTLSRVKPKSFFEFLIDGTIGVWFMNTDYAGLTWTLSVELLASYFIYLLALVPIHYYGRWWVYAFTLVFLYLPRVTDAYQVTQYGFDSMYEVRTSHLYDKAVRQHLPTFAWGVIFADIDSININGRRPLDVLRKLNIWVKIPFNLFLFGLFVIFGSVDIETLSHMRSDDNQRYNLVVTFGYFIGMPVSMLIAALAIFILALTSSVAKCILGSFVFRFLGEISYMLYLLHTLIIEWPMKEIHYYWVQDGMNYDAAAYYVFLIFAPILILLSWAGTMFIDTPAKNLAQKLDLNNRRDVPKPAPGRPGVK